MTHKNCSRDGCSNKAQKEGVCKRHGEKVAPGKETEKEGVCEEHSNNISGLSGRELLDYKRWLVRVGDQEAAVKNYQAQPREGLDTISKEENEGQQPKSANMNADGMLFRVGDQEARAKNSQALRKEEYEGPTAMLPNNQQQIQQLQQLGGFAAVNPQADPRMMMQPWSQQHPPHIYPLMQGMIQQQPQMHLDNTSFNIIAEQSKKIEEQRKIIEEQMKKIEGQRDAMKAQRKNFGGLIEAQKNKIKAQRDAIKAQRWMLMSPHRVILALPPPSMKLGLVLGDCPKLGLPVMKHMWPNSPVFHQFPVELRSNVLIASLKSEAIGFVQPRTAEECSSLIYKSQEAVVTRPIILEMVLVDVPATSTGVTGNHEATEDEYIGRPKKRTRREAKKVNKECIIIDE